MGSIIMWEKEHIMSALGLDQIKHFRHMMIIFGGLLYLCGSQKILMRLGYRSNKSNVG